MPVPDIFRKFPQLSYFLVIADSRGHNDTISELIIDVLLLDGLFEFEMECNEKKCYKQNLN